MVYLHRLREVFIVALLAGTCQGIDVVEEDSTAIGTLTQAINAAESTDASTSSKGLSAIPAAVSTVFSNLKEASSETWQSFKTCQRVRKKLSLHKDELRTKWEDEYEPRELKKKLKEVQGGCSFEEFQFLQRAKRDRFKLLYLTSFVTNKSNWITLIALNVVYPSFIYPAPFIKKLRGARSTVVGETREESISRHRNLLFREFLLQVEKTARTNRNPKAQRLYKLSKLALEQYPMSTDRFLRAINPLIYTKEKGKQGLKVFPVTVFRSLGKMIHGPVGGVPFGIPGIANSIVNEHLRVLESGDHFLVSNSIPLESLSMDGLLECCEDRFIDTAGADRTDLETSLQHWLDNVEIQPKARIEQTQEMYNGSLGRAAVLCHNALTSGCKDPSTAATLPSVRKAESLSIK